MFHRMMIHVTVFLLILALTGCAAGGAFDTGSPEEQRKAALSKDDLWNQSIALEKEKAAYQKQLADQQADIDRMSEELAAQRMKIDRTGKQATELTGALDDLTTRVKQLQDARQREHPLKEASLTQPEKQTEKPGKKAAVPKKELPKKSPSKARAPQSKSDPEPQLKRPQEAERKAPTKQGEKTALPKKDVQGEPAAKEARESGTATIKVLAGDGKIASARALSKQLGKLGYRVKLIDLAPRSDSEATTVYYGTDHHAAAVTMAKKLGGSAVAKPLTWSSSFDIIVVTGRQP